MRKLELGYVDIRSPTTPGRLYCGISSTMLRLVVILCLLISICSIGAFIQLKKDTSNVCDTPECHKRSELLLKSIDVTVEPCDNFYRFVCGNYINNMVIADNATSVNSFTILRNKISEQIRTLLEEDIAVDELRYSKLAKSAYKVCMDDKTIENDGLNTMKKYLNRFGGWPVLEENWNDDNTFNWTNMLFKFRDNGFSVSYLFDVSVMADLVNSTQLVIYLDQPAFGLNKKFLDRNITDSYVEAYYNLMVAVAVSFGANEEVAKKDFLDVLYLERNLSTIATNSEEQENIFDYYENSTIGELNENYNIMSWNNFFDYVIRSSYTFNGTERIIIEDPNFFKKLSNLLESTNKRAIANFLIWRAVKDSVKYLNKDILLKNEVFEKMSYGRFKMVSRWRECVNFIKMNYLLAVNAMYVKRHFNIAKKQVVIEMVKDIKDAFKEILFKADWMDSDTKDYAIKKLNALTANVACPEELLDDDKVNNYYNDYDDVDVTTTYLELQQNLNLCSYKTVYSKLRSPVVKSNWTRHVYATEVNAFYTSSDNMIVVPAAILQDSFFDENLPKYVNYGSIGLAIAHELSHGFDAKGRQFDKDGNAINWWLNETANLYLQKAKCIENQYNDYLVKQVNLHINGKNTLDENIADNGGIKETYLAYKRWLNNNNQKEELHLPNLNYNNEQLFWISSAYMWCSKVRDQQLIRDITLNTHSPNEFRTIGMLSNMKEFSEAFDCKVNTTMNPVNKCELW